MLSSTGDVRRECVVLNSKDNIDGYMRGLLPAGIRIVIFGRVLPTRLSHHIFEKQLNIQQRLISIFYCFIFSIPIFLSVCCLCWYCCGLTHSKLFVNGIHNVCKTIGFANLVRFCTGFALVLHTFAFGFAQRFADLHTETMASQPFSSQPFGPQA